MYVIVRFYQDINKDSQIIRRGLTLDEAQAHCSSDDTKGDGWFDGYQKEEKWSIEELEEHFKVSFYKKIGFNLYFKSNNTIIRVRTLAIYNDMFNQEWFILDNMNEERRNFLNEK